MSGHRWWRVRRTVLVWCGQFWLGLVVTGSYLGQMLPPDAYEAVVVELKFLRGLPEGHPERIPEDGPLTPGEAVLREQLEFLNRVH